MLTLVTGAAGFVGQALARRMAESGYPGRVRLVDRVCPPAPVNSFESLAVDLAGTESLAALVGDADRVIHLAALPGGDAERDPVASRRINVDLPLNLIDALAASRRRPRLVLASSIAVLGAPSAPVDDESPARPAMTYGAHKRMAEIALEDAVRRGDVDAVALRLPGIVARPPGPSGLKSAFASELFWAARDGVPFTLPVGPDATMWLMSARRAADNLIHAAGCALRANVSRVLTLPALHVRMADLVGALADRAATPIVDYRPDPDLESLFGRLPPLRTPAADAAGFRHDGDIGALIDAVFATAPVPA